LNLLKDWHPLKFWILKKEKKGTKPAKGWFVYGSTYKKKGITILCAVKEILNTCHCSEYWPYPDLDSSSQVRAGRKGPF
jgi:hypothetical protein